MFSRTSHTLKCQRIGAKRVSGMTNKERQYLLRLLGAPSDHQSVGQSEPVVIHNSIAGEGSSNGAANENNANGVNLNPSSSLSSASHS